MDINKLGEIEYNHIFEIDNIKRAYFMVMHLNISVKKSLAIKCSDKKVLRRYAKEFKMICKKIINRNNIETFEDYKISVQTLVLIIAKSQEILSDKKYSNNEEIIAIENEYNTINKFLSYSKTYADLFLNNHFTKVLFVCIYLLLIFIFIMCIIFKDYIGVLIVFLFMLGCAISLPFFHRSLYKSFYIDRIHRTINNNTYVNALKINKSHKLFNSFLKVIKK